MTRAGTVLRLTPYALSLFVYGCAVLGPVARHILPSSSAQHLRPAEELEDSYQDLAGVIHVHTNASHDAHGTFEDVVRVANAQGLNYVIITEHNNLRRLREDQQGWHGAVLVLIGTEISTRSGHYLALNVRDEIDRYQPTQAVIDAVNQQGGFGFIAHPYFAKGRWKDWTVTGVTGIEGYNAAHDTLDENKLRLALWTLFSPRDPFYLSILDRPYDPLAMWDRLIAQRGRMVGIGSSDAHEFHALGVKFAPYEDLFHLIRTHLLIPNGAPLDADHLYDALKQGHAYFAMDLVAEVREFTFLAHRGEKVLGIMGDEVTLTPNLELTATLPAPAILTLMKDGQAIATKIGSSWSVPVTEPGAYRLEAARIDKPWIFSNPIYVRPAPSEPPSSPLPNAP